MHVISINVPSGVLKEIDTLVNKKLYDTRSDAIRCAMHDLVTYHKELRPNFTQLPELRQQ